jgi:hemoglobin/transferrin/lactoferrin receptor protein
MKPRSHTLKCLLLLATAGYQISTSAQETQALEEVIVTATRNETPLAEVPYTAEKINSERLAELQPQGFGEALRDVPGISLQQTSHGQVSPFIRGFTGFRTLGLIDGIRVNNSTFRDGPNQYFSTIDVLSLDSLEVVKGQGSVLYGSDAVGGVLNALTKGPVYLEPTPVSPAPKGAKNVQPTAPVANGPYITGLISGRYATAEDSYTGRLEASISEFEKYGFYLGVTGRSFGDLEAADLGTLSHTGYDELGIDAKLELYLADDVKLTVAHNQFHQDDVWRTHRTIYAVPFSGSAVGTEREHYFDQDRYLSYLRLEGTPDNGWLDTYQITLSHQRQSEDLHRRAGDNTSSLDEVDVDSFGFDLQMVSTTDIGKLTYGLSYYLDKVDSSSTKFTAGGTGTAQVQGPVGDDADYHLASAFLQDEIALTDRLDLTLGGRYTFAAADIGTVKNPLTGKGESLSDEWNDFSGSARLLFSVDEQKHFKIFAGASQSFRSPNLSDLSRLDTARSNELETAAPGLDPEKFLTSEIGVRWDCEKLHTSLSYFYTDIKDMIVRAPTGRIIDGFNEVTKLNAGEGHIQGIEFSLDWQLARDWKVFGTVAWQEGEVEGYPDSTDTRVKESASRLLPVTGLVGLRWDSPERHFWLEGTVLMSDRQDELSASDARDTQRIPPGGTPGYTVATLRGGWHVTDNFTLTAAVENFTDEAYRVHGSGLNEPGVNFVVGAKVKF